METAQKSGTRRDVAARKTSWAISVARALARWGIRPNTISIASVLFASLAGVCIGISSSFQDLRESLLLLGAALLMLLRALCNLLDGMVAVEFGMKTKSGEMFNDLPDRLSDSAILIGAGYAIRELPFGIELGWSAALLAMLTAYVRVLGASAGAKHYFLGPMAKQHRIALMTVAAVAGSIISGRAHWILAGALGILALGCVVTLVRRIFAIVRQLEGCGTEDQ